MSRTIEQKKTNQYFDDFTKTTGYLTFSELMQRLLTVHSLGLRHRGQVVADISYSYLLNLNWLQRDFHVTRICTLQRAFNLKMVQAGATKNLLILSENRCHSSVGRFCLVDSSKEP